MAAVPLFLLLMASSLSAVDRSTVLQPIEPIDLPPSIQQGVDMMYIDPEIAPSLKERDADLAEIAPGREPGTPVDMLTPVNPLYTELRRTLVRYQMNWSGLPDVQIPAGPMLKPGAKGERVSVLRERLGLKPGDAYDAELAKKVRAYQESHGIKADGVAGEATIQSLNLGPLRHERLIQINLERALRLPSVAEKGRYVVVDAGGARIYLFEDGKVLDSMKAIVGKPETATPMMAAKLRYASVNPYWNVPPELIQGLIAPKVIAGGVTYLEERGYEVFSDWTEEAQKLDPATVDWQAAAAGTSDIRVRQQPGGANSMGAIKFMMPNDFGIYLHDTPDKSGFQKDDRWISNGCVRVEDAKRLATWLFGDMPKGSDPKVEEKVDLAEPVPVYITYLTVGAGKDGAVFRKDPYSRDKELLARYFGAPAQTAALSLQR
ncbi:MAG TPA: L,D-transpeptidase family protein [Allosphingosinicella sp.]|uniref:L,D-transpeptidase family protein n=1 Tax=Allosphingosinicella sp. TaxID=2823234 RepID=UPI002EDB57DB